MIRSRVGRTLSGLGGLTSLALLSLAACGDENRPRPQPANNSRARRATLPPPRVRRDLNKSAIEAPTEGLTAARSAPAASFVNPKVRPGKVRWHATFADACAASAKSKKPVLLFHLMGQLDHQFC